MQNINNPRLSVIIPCFNKADYLIQMVDCIIKQTFKDWELILIDDGSDEENFNKVHEFVLYDTRIQHIRRSRLPKNGNTCRNIGMDMAKGEYMIIFDADDMISETCFENRVKFMDAHSECDYATFPYASFEEGSSVPTTDKMDKMGTDNGTILKELLSTVYPFTVWANIYRTNALKGIRWDEKLFVYQDLDFMIQCDFVQLKHIYADVSYSDYFYCHFNSGNSVCNNFSEEKIISTNYLFPKIFDLLEERKDKNILLKSFERFLVLHFERLLNLCNDQYIEQYLMIISPYCPNVVEKCQHIKCKIGSRVSGHFNQARIHYYLYKAFGYKFNQVMGIHEFVKWILLRP